MSQPKFDTATGKPYVQNPDINNYSSDGIKIPKELRITHGAEVLPSMGIDFVGDRGIGETKYDEGITPGLDLYLDEIRAQRQPVIGQAINSLGS
jgi:hypothetical protein